MWLGAWGGKKGEVPDPGTTDGKESRTFSTIAQTSFLPCKWYITTCRRKRNSNCDVLWRKIGTRMNVLSLPSAEAVLEALDEPDMSSTLGMKLNALEACPCDEAEDVIGDASSTERSVMAVKALMVRDEKVDNAPGVC